MGNEKSTKMSKCSKKSTFLEKAKCRLNLNQIKKLGK